MNSYAHMYTHTYLHTCTHTFTQIYTQDFYNLVDVYMDAVFHPKCIEDEQTFQQEGWHFELDDTEVCVYVPTDVCVGILLAQGTCVVTCDINSHQSQVAISK